MRKLCRTLGVARRASSAAQKKEARPRAKENARPGTRARELFAATGGTYGSPRLTVTLRRAGERGGRHRVAWLMARAGWRARPKRRFRPPDDRPPASLPHPRPTAWPSARRRPRGPGEGWQADIPCVATREGWLYVAGVIDAGSRQIVGRAADDTMPTGLVARACERAVAAHRPGPGLLHHADRGSQFRQRCLPGVAAPPRCRSQPEPGRATALRTPSWRASKTTMKAERSGEQVFASRAEAKRARFRGGEVFYNRTRLHGAPGFYSPADFGHQLN